MKKIVFSTLAFSRAMAFVLLATGYAYSQTHSGATGTNEQESTAAPAAAEAQTGNLVAAGAASVIVIHGRIVAVDQDKKLVTFQADDGKQVTLHVYNPYNSAAATQNRSHL